MPGRVRPAPRGEPALGFADVDVEPLVDDLLWIAKNTREISPENLRRAASLLAMPRYCR